MATISYGTRISAIVMTAGLALAGCLGGGSSGNSASVASGGSSQVPTTPVNHAPSISGSPTSSIRAGEAYDFRPSASDPDGDTLTFSIQNQPAWTTFDTLTGRLSGTPGDGDVGNYGNIVISVSDGRASSGLTGFSIAVDQIALGSVTLAWSPPTTNADGSPITNLAGYRIYYGRSSTDLDQVVTLDNAGITRYVIENLSPATYYFAMTSFNTLSVESDRSGTVSRTIT